MSGRIIDRIGVTAGEIDNMDIVAHARAILRWIVVAVDGKASELPDRDLRNIRHQIVRDALRVLSDEPRFMGADRIEIAKQRHGQLRIGRGRVPQDNLDHIFCPAVRIGASSDRRRLLDRHLVRRAVNRCGRAENDVMTAVFFHGFEQGECRIQVVSVISERLLHRFADRFVSREMDDDLRLFLFKKSFKRRFIRNIDPIKRKILSDDRFHPV